MCAKAVKQRVPKSAQQALASLMRECAKAERSTGDARRLMARWEVAKQDQEGVLNQLIEMKFIDNRRFAQAYVRDKVNLSGWGAQRISLELSRKGVERDIIDEAMADLDKEAMAERLKSALSKRRRTLKYKDQYDLKNKLMRYGASLGYDYSMVRDAIAEVTQNEEAECSDFYF
ncbi:MAG: regulatory protein RecX [Rikenellaceae bacterium]